MGLDAAEKDFSNLDQFKGNSEAPFDVVQKGETPQVYPARFLTKLNNNWDKTCQLMDWQKSGNPIDWGFFNVAKDPFKVVSSIQNKILEKGGTLPRFGVDGKFGPETERALLTLNLDKRKLGEEVASGLTSVKVNVVPVVKDKAPSQATPSPSQATPSPSQATPSPSSSSPSSPSSSAPDSFEKLSLSLQRDIEKITEGMKGTVEVYIFDPDTKKPLAQIKQNELLPAASLIKVPILFALHKAVNDGRVKKEDVPRLMKDAELMISKSDNSATDRIAEYIGIKQIKKTIEELGLENTKFGGLMRDKTTRKNWITAQDMSKIMTLAITQEPPAGWPSAMDLMQISGHTGKLGAMIPEDVKIARKCGQIANHEHYAAVYTLGNKRLVMVVMVSKYDTRERAKEGIRKIGMLVYNTLKAKNAETPKGDIATAPDAALSS